jgi:hypothetical protein
MAKTTEEAREAVNELLKALEMLKQFLTNVRRRIDAKADRSAKRKNARQQRRNDDPSPRPEASYRGPSPLS